MINLPYEVKRIIERLESVGFEGYAVGGCVRDTLLGIEAKDWDITTSAKPLEVKRLFRRTFDTGIAHGTLTVLLESGQYEVTTYRVDGIYSDGRHPDSVSFTPSLEEDLKRRDFTINAMAYTPRTGLVDLFAGKMDLEKRMLRCVGDARGRFREDALRMLRAIRFSVQLGFSIEEDTYQAIIDLAYLLKNVSKERIYAELNKMLESVHLENMIHIKRTGIDAYICEHFEDISISSFMLLQRKEACGAGRVVLYALLFHTFLPEKASVILKALKADTVTCQKVKILLTYVKYSIDIDRIHIKRLLSKLEYEMGFAWIRLQKILAKGDASICEKLSTIEQIMREMQIDREVIHIGMLAINGKDLIEAGFKPGSYMGEILKHLLDMVIEEKIENRLEDLLQEAKDFKYI